MSHDMYRSKKPVEDTGIHSKAFDTRVVAKSPLRKLEEKRPQIRWSPTREMQATNYKKVQHQTGFDTRWQAPDPLKVRKGSPVVSYSARKDQDDSQYVLTHQRGVVSIMCLETKVINPYGIHDAPFDLDTRPESPQDKRRKLQAQKWGDSIKTYQKDTSSERAPVSLKAQVHKIHTLSKKLLDKIPDDKPQYEQCTIPEEEWQEKEAQIVRRESTYLKLNNDLQN